MSTNYEIRFNECEGCGRYDSLHHGKGLGLKRAYTIKFDYEDPPTPWGEIDTWEKWKEVLRSPGVKLYSDYDGPLDVESFIEECETSEHARDAALRQFEAGQRYASYAEMQFLEGGFHFYPGEFS